MNRQIVTLTPISFTNQALAGVLLVVVGVRTLWSEAPI
jgi:hypothetical protein